jgi:hypothetical protein
MDNIVIFKSTEDMNKGVNFPDIVQELVAYPFTRAGSSYQTGNIDDLMVAYVVFFGEYILARKSMRSSGILAMPRLASILPFENPVTSRSDPVSKLKSDVLPTDGKPIKPIFMKILRFPVTYLYHKLTQIMT